MYESYTGNTINDCKKNYQNYKYYSSWCAYRSDIFLGAPFLIIMHKRGIILVLYAHCKLRLWCILFIEHECMWMWSADRRCQIKVNYSLNAGQLHLEYILKDLKSISNWYQQHAELAHWSPTTQSLRGLQSLCAYFHMLMWTHITRVTVIFREISLWSCSFSFSKSGLYTKYLSYFISLFLNIKPKGKLQAVAVKIPIQIKNKFKQSSFGKSVFYIESMDSIG